MTTKLRLTIFFIHFCFIVSAQNNDSYFEIHFEYGDSVPYSMEQTQDEYHNGQLVQKRGRNIKFLYFLPPKYEEIQDTLRLSIAEHLDKISKKNSLVYFVYPYEYIEGYWEKYIPISHLSNIQIYPHHIYIYPRKIFSQYKTIQQSFTAEKFDSIKNQTLYFPITYYQIDTPFRVIGANSFQEELVEELTIAKVYHLQHNWKNPKQLSSEFACILRYDTVTQIQIALKERGYPITINRKFDGATTEALKAFQRDYNKSYALMPHEHLTVGLLEKKTLIALGISPFDFAHLPRYQYKNSPWNNIRNW